MNFTTEMKYYLSIKKLSRVIFLTLLLAACAKEKQHSESSNAKEIPLMNYAHVADYPHDQQAFTEGLLFHEGKLYESTGASNVEGTRSLFGEVDLTTGEIAVKAELDLETYFGEGITFLNGLVYQLTYTSRKGFVYDAKTYELVGEFTIPSKEGWGMTTDGKSLIMSDGTNELTYLDPETLLVSRKIKVREGYYARDLLNELEYVEGHIYANVFTTNEIVKIDPKNGNIMGKLDLTEYANDARNTSPEALEMNGIAYHPEKKSFFITGKMWPKIYEIKVNQ